MQLCMAVSRLLTYQHWAIQASLAVVLLLIRQPQQVSPGTSQAAGAVILFASDSLVRGCIALTCAIACGMWGESSAYVACGMCLALPCLPCLCHATAGTTSWWSMLAWSQMCHCSSKNWQHSQRCGMWCRVREAGETLTRCPDISTETWWRVLVPGPEHERVCAHACAVACPTCQTCTTALHKGGEGITFITPRELVVRMPKSANP